MSIDKKSLTELRSIATSMGIIADWGDDKAHLLQKISLHVGDKIEEPPTPILINIIGNNNPIVTREAIEVALEGFKPLGLVLSFPDGNTWEIYCNRKRDSGSFCMPLWNIIQCAKGVVAP